MKKLLILWLIAFSSVLFAQSQRVSIKQLELACEQNLYIACEILGTRYENGDDVQKDYFKAVELYQKSWKYMKTKYHEVIGR